MPRPEAAPSPAVNRIVDSCRETHARIVEGRVIARFQPEKLKHPEKSLP